MLHEISIAEQMTAYTGYKALQRKRRQCVRSEASWGRLTGRSGEYSECYI